MKMALTEKKHVEMEMEMEKAQLLRRARRQCLRERLGPCLAKNTVCRHWLKGKCTRNPFKFMHGDPQAQQTGNPVQQSRKYTWENPSKIAKPVQPEALAAIKPETEEIAKPVEPKALAARKAETEEVHKTVNPKALAARKAETEVRKTVKRKAMAPIEAETEEVRKTVKPKALAEAKTEEIPVQPKALAAIEAETEEIRKSVTTEGDRITDQKPRRSNASTGLQTVVSLAKSARIYTLGFRAPDSKCWQS